MDDSRPERVSANGGRLPSCNVTISPRCVQYIYSSGTLVNPGIVQSHGQCAGRTSSAHRVVLLTVRVRHLISTPLLLQYHRWWSFCRHRLGGTVVLMAKFGCRKYLVAEATGCDSTIVVRLRIRIMAAGIDSYDLSRFHMSSVPAPPSMPSQATSCAWPGGLIEFYGMTEGGGTCCWPRTVPGQLATVGQAAWKSRYARDRRGWRELAFSVEGGRGG